MIAKLLVFSTLAIVCANEAFAQADARPPERLHSISQLSELASQSGDILKLVATVASIVGTVVAIIGGLWSIRKTKAEIQALEQREQAPGTAAQTPSLLSDARIAIALLIAMDFVIATIITTLTHYALNFIVAPFSGTLGEWVYDILQGIIVAALFLPIVSKARSLKKMVIA